MSLKLLKLGLVLVLLFAFSAAQAFDVIPGEPGQGPGHVRPGELVQGCCWKKTGTLLICTGGGQQSDCPSDYTFVANKNCGSADCGG